MNKINMVMTNTVFDALGYAKKLKQVGVSAEQAEMHAETISDLTNKLATKEDLQNMQQALGKDIEFAKMDLKFWFGKMLGAAVMILAALIALMPALYK